MKSLIDTAVHAFMLAMLVEDIFSVSLNHCVGSFFRLQARVFRIAFQVLRSHIPAQKHMRTLQITCEVIRTFQLKL